MIKIIDIFSRSNCFERFFTRIISLILFMFLLSCSKEEIKADLIDKSLAITIDNENFKITNNSITSNESCDGVFASCKYQNSNDNGFRIEFSLKKNGALRNIRLVDYRVGNLQFESADFNPRGLMSITNFEYDEVKKYLHFDFDGSLLTQAYSTELDINKERKHVIGTITINNVSNTGCTSLITKLNFTTKDLNFLTTIPFASYNSGLTINPYICWFYSDNGYRTIIKSKNDLWNLPIDTYTFTQNSIENRIAFDQYIGIFRSTQLLWVRDIDWKKFQTSGSYTILEHVIINGEKVTRGEMNMQVFDNGVQKYNITNAKFEVVGF